MLGLTLAFSSQQCYTTHLREIIYLSEQVAEHGVYVVHLRMVEQNTSNISNSKAMELMQKHYGWPQQ